MSLKNHFFSCGAIRQAIYCCNVDASVYRHPVSIQIHPPFQRMHVKGRQKIEDNMVEGGTNVVRFKESMHHNDEIDFYNESGTLLHGSSRKGINVIRELKDKAKSLIREVAHPAQSQFFNWESNDLGNLLVDNNIQVRGSARASKETLVRICDEVFGSHEILDYEKIRSK